MKSVMKEAARDAAEYAGAKMSYGEGAGIRRKLISTAVDYKASRIPGYSEAFETALHSQDLTKHVRSAKRTQRVKGASAVASKNLKAAVRGDGAGMSTPILAGLIVLAVAHRTGYDRVVYDKVSDRVTRARLWLKRRL